MISAVEFNLKYPEEQLFYYHPEYKSDYKKYRDMSELSKESIKDVPASDRDDSEKWELIFTYMDGDWKSEYKNYGYRNIFTGKIKIESFCMGPGGSSGTDIYDSIEELRSSLKRIKEYGSPYNYEECNGFSIDDNSISDTNEKSSIE